MIREYFATHVEQVMENIADPNTPAEVAREVTITVRFKPDATRRDLEITVHPKTKLAAFRPAKTVGYLSSDGAIAEAYTVDPRQPDLEGVEDERIRNITGAEHGR